MATDPKKNNELKDEQLEETAGGIIEVGRPRLDDDGSADNAGNQTDRMSL